MTRKCHNHKLQTHPRHRDEETQNIDGHMNHRSKAISSLFLPNVIAELKGH